MKRTATMLIVALAVMTALLGGAVAAPEGAPAVQTPPPPADQPAGVEQPKGLQALTAEQRDQVQAKVKEMRAAGAKPEEIRTTVTGMLKGWGIEPGKLRLGLGTGQGRGRAVLAQLTKEQRTQVRDKMKAMREAGAKPEEIRAAVADMLKGWGITAPAAPDNGPGRGWMAALTKEQRRQVQAKIKELRAADAKPEDIKAAVAEMLKGWGVQIPEGGLTLGGGEQGGRAWLAQLTKEQRRQVQAKIKELRAADAKPEDIKAAVAEMLKGWGVQIPEGGLTFGGRGEGARGRLTADQREQVQAKMKEMKAAGAKPEEIKATVTEMYKGFGVEPPAAQGQKAGGRHEGLKQLMDKLTAEQRDQLQAKVKEMRAAAKTPEEIRAAVTEMVKGWGVEE